MKLSDLLEIEYGSQNLLQTYQDQIKEIDPEQYRKLQLMMSQQQDNEVAKWITNALESGKLEHIDDLPPDDKALAKIREYIREEIEKVTKEAKTKPAKGKRFAKKVKNPKTGRTRTVSYGQAGKAKKGGDRIRPGTAKGHAYCARSAKIKKCKNPPCANTLSRKKWKCQGSRSVK